MKKYFAIIFVLLLSMSILTSCIKKTDSDQNQISNDSANKDDKMKKSNNPIVVFETSKGNFEVELYADKAPISVANFISYVNSSFYDGLIFHRVIGNFMVQGGGFDKDLNQKKTLAPIKNEAKNGLSNDRYTIAMARTPIIDSATSQFFINVVDNKGLNYRGESMQEYGYAVFGKVVSGFDVIDSIKVVKTHSVGPYDDVPVEPVAINRAYLKSN